MPTRGPSLPSPHTSINKGLAATILSGTSAGANNPISQNAELTIRLNSSSEAKINKATPRDWIASIFTPRKQAVYLEMVVWGALKQPVSPEASPIPVQEFS